MARKIVDMRDVAFRAIVDGDGLVKPNKTALAKELNVTRGMIYAYRERPASMKLGQFRIMVKALKLTDEQILKIIR